MSIQHFIKLLGRGGVCLLAILALNAGHLQAGVGRAEGLKAKYKAMDDQQKLHTSQSRKVRAVQTPQVAPVARWRVPNVARSVLKGGLLALAVTTDPMLASAALTVIPPPLPAPANLAPATSFAGQGITLALARANRTGALPPTEDLQGMLTQRGSQFGPLLTSLASAGGTLTGADSAPITQEMRVALNAMTFAQQNEAFYILELVAHQFLGVALTLSSNPPLAIALNLVATEIDIAALAIGAGAYHDQADFAWQTFHTLQTDAQAAAKPFSTPAPGAAVVARRGYRSELTDALDVGAVYGHWQRIENALSGEQVLYKWTANGLDKVRVSTDDRGRRQVRTERHAGTVSGYVEYPVADEGDSLRALEPAKATLVIEKTNGDTTTFTFRLLKIQEQGVDLGILVERDGEKKAFIKVSDF